MQEGAKKELKYFIQKSETGNRNMYNHAWIDYFFEWINYN